MMERGCPSAAADQIWQRRGACKAFGRFCSLRLGFQILWGGSVPRHEPRACVPRLVRIITWQPQVAVAGGTTPDRCRNCRA